MNSPYFSPITGHGDSPPLRSNANSRSSQSSGLGSASGSSRLQTSRKPFGGPTLSTNGFNLKRNNNAAMMFPTQMPPVDKLLGGRDSAGKRYGFTTYDEVSISPTFYKQLFCKKNCSAQLFYVSCFDLLFVGKRNSSQKLIVRAFAMNSF